MFKICFMCPHFAMIGDEFSIIHAVLCIKFKANQVISGVVINILALALTAFLTTQINALVLERLRTSFDWVSERFTIEGLANIPVIGAIFTDVYPFQVIIIVIAIFAWYLLYKTRFGMRLRASGENPHAVDARCKCNEDSIFCGSNIWFIIRFSGHVFCLFHFS